MYDTKCAGHFEMSDLRITLNGFKDETSTKSRTFQVKENGMLDR